MPKHDKTTAPALPLMSGDWLKGTARLSAAERGYFLDLLLYSWDNDEAVPDDEREQMQIARCTDRREWRRVWSRLSPKWQKVDGGFRNDRLELARAELAEYREGKSRSGKKGAEARWHRDGTHHGESHGKRDGKRMAELLANGMANGWPSSSSSPSEIGAGQERPLRSAREDVAWSRHQRGALAGSSLVGDHRRCDPIAAAACARGVCVPAKLTSRWRAQFCGEIQAADAAISACVDAGVATLPPTGPVGGDMFTFWDGRWAIAHPPAATMHAPRARIVGTTPVEIDKYAGVTEGDDGP
jgi:uncharacterized protein YdaU (DUF1376 family)